MLKRPSRVSVETVMTGPRPAAARVFPPAPGWPIAAGYGTIRAWVCRGTALGGHAARVATPSTTLPADAPVASASTTAAAATERAKLQRHFGRADMTFFLICTLVGVDTVGAIAANGGQAFTWLIVLAVLFFLPSALIVAELGSTFPDEGGPYIWPRMAFGHLVGAVNNVLYWITNPVWLGGTLALLAATVVGTFFTHSADGSLSGFAFYAVTVPFVWVGVLAAVLSLSVGKWIPTIGALMRVLVLGFFSVTVVVYAAVHGVHGVPHSDFAPTYVTFLALVPLLLFNYVGFELPSGAGEEMTDPAHDVPRAVAVSGVASVLLYGVPILGILLVLPATAITNLGGFIDAIKTVFTVYGGTVTASGGATLSGAGTVLGDLVAVGFILTILTSGVTWIMGSDRALAVSGYDGAAPRSLGVFSARFGTPVRVNLLSGVVATVVLVAAHSISHGSAADYFGVVLGLAISSTFVSYLAIFPAALVLRYRARDTVRPYRVPFGTAGIWVATVLATGFILVGVLALVWPGIGIGWFGTSGSSADGLPDAFAGRRLAYELATVVPLLLFVALGVVFWAMGAPTRRQLARDRA